MREDERYGCTTEDVSGERDAPQGMARSQSSSPAHHTRSHTLLLIIDARERLRPPKVHADTSRLRHGLERLLALSVNGIFLHIEELTRGQRAGADGVRLCST